MEALLKTLIERQSVEFKELKDSLKELKAENEILRKEILGIGVSEASSGQQGTGLMEKRTLREIVEENQFHLKALNAKLERSLHELVAQNKQEGHTESTVTGSYSGHSHFVNINNPSKPESKSEQPGRYPRKPYLAETPARKSLRPPGIPLQWPLLPKLPDCELAIHFGLHRTLAGIVTPGTDDVLILQDIDNCIYFDHPDLILSSEDPKCQKYKPSRIPNILETPPNLTLEVIIGKMKRLMRLEELIACFFAALKWKTELDQMVEISKSVICIPQCLNENRRKTVHDAARIAGFRRVTLIDDTSAVALAFMLKNSVAKSSVIIANTSEGFIDTGYFNFDNGIIHRVGVSGEYFTKKKGDRRMDNKHMHLLGNVGTENTAFRENVLQIFKGYVDESGSPIARRQSPLKSIILPGNPSELVKQVQRVLDFDPHLNYRRVQHFMEDDKAALSGAAYLTVLNDFKPEHPICERWATLIRREPSQELKIFRKYLLHQKPVQGVRTLTNLPTGGNLDKATFTTLKENFYLNERWQGPEMKMQILKKLVYLESSARRLSQVCHHDKQDIIDQIDTIRRDMETSKFTVEQLYVYDHNLNDLLD